MNAATISAPAKPLTRRERGIATSYRRLLKAQERASVQYELADRIAYRIAQQIGGSGKSARISPDGKGILVVDNYKSAVDHPKRQPHQMPKAWGHAAVRQFELKEISLFPV